MTAAFTPNERRILRVLHLSSKTCGARLLKKLDARWRMRWTRDCTWSDARGRDTFPTHGNDRSAVNGPPAAGIIPMADVRSARSRTTRSERPSGSHAVGATLRPGFASFRKIA